MGKRIAANRVIIDPEKVNKLVELVSKDGLSLADVSREIGRSYCYLSNIKNYILREDVDMTVASSKNSIQKLEYDYILNKWGVDIKYEAPVEVKVPVSNKNIPPEQGDIYIAVYFGVLDAMRDFRKECEESDEHKEEEPKEEPVKVSNATSKKPKITSNESLDDKKIIKQK